ncbi:MAG: response regulator transcription factor [Pyrinomonadaceae bacterium]|nr:response regulator transcription factor [Sphingobacteriaceae bacterium]
MKYKCLVADDNLIDRELVIRHLSKIDTIQIVAVCDDGNDAARVLAEEQIDIVFSDIDMPNLSGIGLIKGLKQAPVFIFITSYAEYAVESFNLDVIDFIVKPLSFERLFKSVNKAIEYLELKNLLFGQKRNTVAELGEQKNLQNNEYFFIKETHGITKLSYADVLYIESLGDFSKIFTIKKEKHVTLVSLKNLEKQLPALTFMRIHKQYIINLEHIITITTNEIHLANKQVIPLSSVYKQELLDVVVNKKIITRFSV